jgi:hypothetical protein
MTIRRIHSATKTMEGTDDGRRRWVEVAPGLEINGKVNVLARA